MPTACPASALLVDGFDGDRLDAALWAAWADSGVMIGVGGSRLEITADTDDASGGIDSVSGLPLDESSLVLSSVGLPAETRLSLWGQNYASVTPLVLSFGSATWCKMNP